MRYMLDTNICIYAIKHKPEKAFKRSARTRPIGNMYFFCYICRIGTWCRKRANQLKRTGLH